MFQPFTTGTTLNDLKRARNSMRLRLWSDEVNAHQWLCHPGTKCEDGCDQTAIPSRLALYTSELEDEGGVTFRDGSDDDESAEDDFTLRLGHEHS